MSSIMKPSLGVEYEDQLRTRIYFTRVDTEGKSALRVFGRFKENYGKQHRQQCEVLKYGVKTVWQRALGENINELPRFGSC